MTKSEIITSIKDQKSILSDMQIGASLWTIIVGIVGCIAYMLFNIKDWQQFNSEVMPWLWYVIPFYLPIIFIFKSLKENKLRDWYKRYTLKNFDSIKFVYLTLTILCYIGSLFYPIDVKFKLITLTIPACFGCVIGMLYVPRRVHKRVPYSIFIGIYIILFLLLVCGVVQKAIVSGLPSRKAVYMIGVVTILCCLLLILLEHFFGESASKIKLLNEQLFYLESHDTVNTDEEWRMFTEVVAGSSFYALFRDDFFKLNRSHIKVNNLIIRLNAVDSNKLACDKALRKQSLKMNKEIVKENKYQLSVLDKMLERLKKAMKDDYLSEESLEQLDNLISVSDTHLGLIRQHIADYDAIIRNNNETLVSGMCKYAKYKIGKFCPVHFWYGIKQKAEFCKPIRMKDAK